MGFARDTKAELARLIPERRCCLRAEFAALLRFGGSLHLRSGRSFLRLQTEVAAVARKIVQLGRFLLRVQPKVFAGPIKMRQGHRYLIEIPVRTDSSMLKQLGLLNSAGELTYIPNQLTAKRCCRRAYLRGVFLGAGSMTNPERTYHLEIAVRDWELGKALLALLQRLGITAKLSHHHQNYALFIKNMATISKMLSLMGASSARLCLEETQMRKDLRNQVNRLVNAETANIKKSIESGLAQVEAIRKLELASLPPRLRQVAELRLKFPELSLAQLGSQLDPPLSKSGVNHRLRELVRLAQRKD